MNDYPLFEGMLNSSVLPDDELRLTKQCRLMFERLLKGPATNVELMDLCKSRAPTARRTDLRQEVQRFGWNLNRIKNLGGGVNLYALFDADKKIVRTKIQHFVKQT